jgi:predicted Zn finger-like uncharacterized protein
MPIKVTCAGCQAPYTVPDNYAGKQIRCKRCQSNVTVPGASIRAAGPAPAAHAAPAAGTLQASCPNCHAVYKLPDSARGKSARCKKCQTSFVVGAPQQEEELVAIQAAPRTAPPPPTFAVQPAPPVPPPLGVQPAPAYAATAPVAVTFGQAAPHGSPLHQFVQEATQTKPGPVAFWSIFGGVSGMLLILLILTPFAFLSGLNKLVGGGAFAFVNGRADVLGTLTARDPFDAVVKHSRCKVHTVELTAGKTYRIFMAKNDPLLDPYLRLEDASGKQLAADDDSGGDLNALIMFPCTNTGKYRIIATTFNGSVGRYALSVTEQEGAAPAPGGQQVQAGGGDQEPAAGGGDKAAPAAAIEMTLQNGKATVDGEFKANSPRDAKKKDSPVQYYTISLTAGRTYQIDMMKKANSPLDPFLRLEDPAGRQLAFDDDGGEGLNSRIVFQCPADGTYRIAALTAVLGRVGAYTLTVTQK